jgi:hypothetical protein
MNEALDDLRRPTDEEGVDPVKTRHLRDGLDAGEVLPRGDDGDEDRELPGEHPPPV